MQIVKEKRIGLFSCIFVDEIESTNTYLKEHYQDYNEPIVLIANKQTKGRGRYNRVWLSQDDLCFSILFFKEFTNQFLAPIVIIRVLQKLGVDALIKWPNDIYLNGQKLAGILIEDLYERNYQASVIGIGINFCSKPEVGGIGLVDYINLTKEGLLSLILLEYQEILTENLADLLNEFKKYNFVIGKHIIYHQEEYLVEDINQEGHLILSNQKETIHVSCDEIDIKTAIGYHL